MIRRTALLCGLLLSTLPLLLLPLSLLPLSSLAADKNAQEEIDIINPTGGWRSGQADTNHFQQEVHYPANSVSTPPDQGKNSMIRGQIAHHPKDNKTPYTLVVNGIPMPLRIEPEGSFSRPYSFAKGSNSVEVRTPDGKVSKRVQFYDQQSGQLRPKLRVLLAWDTDNTDLDLHLITPDGEHVYYGNRVSKHGDALDVDVTTGYGPEIISSVSPLPGQYLVYVNYYGSGENEKTLTTAQVSIITDEGEVDEQRQTVFIPMRHAGELTLVKRFILP